MITEDLKKQICQAVADQLPTYKSANKMAVILDINPAQLSRVKNGDIDNVLSDAKWVTIARRLGVQIGQNNELAPARTPTFDSIEKQLTACQQFSLSGLLCDMADIGKTYAAKHYVKKHQNAVYIDCSLCKTKQQLIRAIAKEFGLGFNYRYNEVFGDLVFYLRTLPNPLIVLDEAGDLAYPAFLELKALWNATENLAGWYMMGADGLRAKIEKNLNHRKVGYAEIFSRYGSRFQKFTPDGGVEKTQFIKEHIAMIGRANGVTNAQQLYVNTGGSLRRISIEIKKLKAAANNG